MRASRKVKRPKGIVFLTQWFPPEPGVVVPSIVEALAELGPLEVVTGIPNYPTGKVNPGYRWWRAKREMRRGIPVHRVPLIPSHSFSSFGRILNYASFALSSCIVTSWLSRGSRGVVVYGSPVTAALGPLLARHLFGTRYVVLVEDLWPDSLLESDMVPTGMVGRCVCGIADWFSYQVYRHAAALLPISDGMAQVLLERGLDPDSIRVVMNWAPKEFDQPMQSTGALRQRLHISNETLVLLYAGNLGATHDLHLWIEAICDLRAPVPVVLVFLGDGVAREELESRTSTLGCPDIFFLHRVDDVTYESYLADADAVLVSLRRGSALGTAMPSKIPSALAAGKVILGSVDGDPACAIQLGGGLVARDGSVAALREIIGQFAAELPSERQVRAQRARQYYQLAMSREVGTQRLRECLHDSLQFP